MIKILGLIDLCAAMLLWLTTSDAKIPIAIMIAVPVVLFIKAFFFMPDIGSYFDIGIVLLLVLSIFVPFPPLAIYVGVAVIGLKGLMSMFA